MSCSNIYMNELEEIFYNSYTNNDTGYNNIVMPTKYGIGSYSLYATKYSHFISSSFTLKRDLNIQSMSQESLFFIAIIYDGDFYMKDKYHDIELLTNRVYLGFGQEDMLNSSILPKNQKLQTFSFLFSKEQLIEYLIEIDANELIKKVNTVEVTEILKEIHLSIKSNYIIQKFMQNPYNGNLKDIYIESIIYELLISLLSDLRPQRTKGILLSSDDKEILHKAKDILLSDLQNPPTIEALSKMVPMNQSKLKSGFKVLFNNTIYKTLTDHRMKQAFENLKNNDMTIWEIAHEAGYENVGHFITTFRKKYGKTPGQIKQEKKIYW